MARFRYCATARSAAFSATAGLALAGAALSSACGSSPTSGEDAPPQHTSRHGQPLLGSSRDEALRYPFVGYVRAFDEKDGILFESICSGVQLSCGAVLTAAHCLEGSRSFTHGSFSTHYHSGDCGRSEDGHVWSFSTPIIMPGYLPSSSPVPSDSNIQHDIAILPLVADQDLAFRRTARSLRYAKLGDVGSALSAAAVTEVGYGSEARADLGGCLVDEECTPFSQLQYGAYRKYAEMTVDHIGGTWQGLQLLGVNGSMAVPGDSGGPVLLGGDTVIGIQSSTDGSQFAPCEATKAWAANVTHPTFAQWVRDQLAALDRDGDEMPDACDPCPDVPDDGYDADGDGVGDACDDCPCDPRESRAFVADKKPDNDLSDGDGRCGSCSVGLALDTEGRCAALCPSVVLDTCPNVFNDDAENCNLDAERAMGARILADACDPVPCPRFDSNEKSSVVARTVPLGGPSKGFEGELYVEKSSTGRLLMNPVGAHQSPEILENLFHVISDPAQVLEYPVAVEWSEYRYCVDLQSQEIDCSALSHINEGLLRVDPDREHERAKSVWHRISIDGPGIPLPSVEANPLDHDLNPYHSSTKRERVWGWEADFAFWSSSAWGAELPYGVPTEPEEGRGRLWVHAQTLQGMDLAHAEHGVHGRADDITVPQPGLANAFQDISPIATKTRFEIHKVLLNEPIKLELTARPCLTCGPQVFGPDSIERPAWGYPLVQAPGASPGEAQQIVTVPGSDALAVLLHDGSLLDISGSIGAGLQASLSLGLRWVDAVEPDPAAGAGARAPTALGLSPDGSRIVERVHLLPGRLLGQTDISPTHGDLLMKAGAETASHLSPLAPRVEPLVVYSRSSRQLFVVGGRDPNTGSQLTDIGRADVDTGSWTRIVPKGVTLGQVLATTYSPRDRKLWILDTVGVGRSARARLIRLEPGTGQVQMLGEWQRSGKFDHHWLILDRDASVMLATSSEKVNKHVVIHFDDSKPVPEVDRTYAGQHALALPPVVDSEGYALTTRIAPKKMPVTVRVKTLVGGIGHWGGLSTCL